MMARPHQARCLLGGVLLLVAALTGATARAAPPRALQATTLSAGCGRAATPGTDQSGTLAYGGGTRTYLLHVPAGYTETVPLPLILNLPGAGMTSSQEEWLTRMSNAADQQGALVVYPQATSPSLTWNTGLAGNAASGVDDVGFLGALVLQLESQYCVDATRVDATGISQGAVMAYHLACSNISWLAAIAPVAGTMPTAQSNCVQAHPTPLLAFHGTADWVLPYGGWPWLWIPSIPQVVAAWAQAQGCEQTPDTALVQPGVTEEVYTGCQAETVLYTITDGGHTWPGGNPMPWFGTTTTALDGSATILAFCATHPLH